MTTTKNDIKFSQRVSPYEAPRKPTAVKPLNLHNLIVRQANSVRRTYQSKVTVPGPTPTTPEQRKQQNEKNEKVKKELNDAAQFVEKRIQQMSDAYGLHMPTYVPKTNLMKPWTQSSGPNGQLKKRGKKVFRVNYYYRTTKIAAWRVARSRCPSEDGRSYQKFIERLSYLVLQGKRKMTIHADNTRTKNLVLDDRKLISTFSRIRMRRTRKASISIPTDKRWSFRRKKVSVEGAVQILMGLDRWKVHVTPKGYAELIKGRFSQGGVREVSKFASMSARLAAAARQQADMASIDEDDGGCMSPRSAALSTDSQPDSPTHKGSAANTTGSEVLESDATQNEQKGSDENENTENGANEENIKAVTDTNRTDYDKKGRDKKITETENSTETEDTEPDATCASESKSENKDTSEENKENQETERISTDEEHLKKDSDEIKTLEDNNDASKESDRTSAKVLDTSANTIRSVKHDNGKSFAPPIKKSKNSHDNDDKSSRGKSAALTVKTADDANANNAREPRSISCCSLI